METKNKQKPVRILEDAQSAIEKLFVYGIFLDETNRENYGMENPSYDTVRGFITIGDYIVRAVPSTILGASLTGLLVDVPTRNFQRIDILETGYARIKVQTSSGIEAFMYSLPCDLENFSTVRSNFYEGNADESQEAFAL